jgi:hypothetical protein
MLRTAVKEQVLSVDLRRVILVTYYLFLLFSKPPYIYSLYFFID